METHTKPEFRTQVRAEELLFRAEAPLVAEDAIRTALAQSLRERDGAVSASADDFVADALAASRGHAAFETLSPAARGRLLRGVAACAQAFVTSAFARRLLATPRASFVRHGGAAEIAAVLRAGDDGVHVVGVTRLRAPEAIAARARAIVASLRLPRDLRSAAIAVHLYSLADRRARRFSAPPPAADAAPVRRVS